MALQRPRAPKGPAASRAPKLKQKWLRLPAPPASLEETLANVAHLETDMVCMASGQEVEQILQRRPYTSGGVSALSAEDTVFSADNSMFSRPSTSAVSWAGRSRAASSRSRFRPRPWCRSSPCPSTRVTRDVKGYRARVPGGSGGSTTPSQDLRGYENFEQLLQPGWRSPAELHAPDSPKQEDREDLEELLLGGRRRSSAFLRQTEKRNAVVQGLQGMPGWAAKPEQPQVTAPSRQQSKRNALKSEPKDLLKDQPEPVADKTSSSASSAESASDSASDSSESVDPQLATDIGDLLPQRNVGWANTLTHVQKEATQTRRGGLDKDMITLAQYAVAAQQAALREEEEARLPVQALPGVYFGHLDSPQSSLLPQTPKLARLQFLEHKKLSQDNVHQRKLLSLPQQDTPFFSRKMTRMESMMPHEDQKAANRKKMASTWGESKEPKEKGPLTPEEEERIKEEKAQYDDWRRQVLLCARHLNTHINRFETDPVVGTGKAFQF